MPVQWPLIFDQSSEAKTLNVIEEATGSNEKNEKEDEANGVAEAREKEKGAMTESVSSFAVEQRNARLTP